MSEQYLFDAPTRVTVGTVGPVGERLFVMQISDALQTVTVKMEKVQVATLASYMGRMLRELERPHELPSGAALDLDPFESPDFAAESLALSYDEITDRIVLVVDEVDASADDEEDEEDGQDEPELALGSVVRVAMTREQAAALAIRATELVEAGRPPCPLCGYPLDPRGHACPRTNGHHAPLT